MERFGIKLRTLGIAALVFGLTLSWAPAARAQQAPDTEKKEVEAKVKEEAKKEEGPEKPQWSISTDILSQYVWRGIALSRGSGVFQPSLTGSYKGFSANVWGNFDTSEANPFGLKNPNNHQPRWNETDLTFSYSYEVVKNLTLTGGTIIYILDTNNSKFNSTEIFGGFTYKFPWFDVGFSAYREVAHLPGTYLQWNVSRSFNLPWWGMSLDLWAAWSAELSNDKAAYPIPNDTGGYKNQFYQSLHAGHLMATLNFPLGKYVKFSPKVMYWYALGGDSTGVIGGPRHTNPGLSWDRQHNHFLGGANFSVSF